MLDFINTDLFKKDRKISIIVFSNYFYRGKTKLLSLIDGENAVIVRDTNREMLVTVEKNGLQIDIITASISESSRGRRAYFSFVDRSIFDMENGAELFYNVISPITMAYSHVLIDENKKPSVNIMIF